MRLLKEELEMEYVDGVLIVSCKGDRCGGCIEMIKWEDVRSIQFNSVVMPDWKNFVVPPNPQITI